MKIFGESIIKILTYKISSISKARRTVLFLEKYFNVIAWFLCVFIKRYACNKIQWDIIHIHLVEITKYRAVQKSHPHTIEPYDFVTSLHTGVTRNSRFALQFFIDQTKIRVGTVELSARHSPTKKNGWKREESRGRVKTSKWIPVIYDSAACEGMKKIIAFRHYFHSLW